MINEELVKIVGADNVLTDNAILKEYSGDYSIAKPVMPTHVVKPHNADDVQRIIKLANETKLPVVPCSSGVHFDGNTIPAAGGMILDLSRMNKILSVQERNRMVRVEPGVTWGQLQTELQKHDLMALSPLLPHPAKSVLSSHLEREPMLIPKFEYADTLVTMEVVLPEGDRFNTGSAAVRNFPDSMSDGVFPGGPGNTSWNWILQGAQGTLGVVTWAQVKIEYRPEVNKTFFIPFSNISEASEFARRIQRRMIGEECLILNDFNLAAILAKQWPEDFNSLRQGLAPWTLVLVLGGGKRFPEEKIEYEEDGLRAAAAELSITELPTSLPGYPEAEKIMPNLLRTPWPAERTYWKFAYKGSCQNLFFHTKLTKVDTFVQAINKIAEKHDYPLSDTGFYVQPLDYGRACHFECNFYFNPQHTAEVQKIRSLFTEAAATVFGMGAFFARPYGLIADMVYDKAASYTMAYKKVKQWLDPNRIMSPDRLSI
jgi:FAD/FMN-containing dehydrogenase